MHGIILLQISDVRLYRVAANDTHKSTTHMIYTWHALCIYHRCKLIDSIHMQNTFKKLNSIRVYDTCSTACESISLNLNFFRDFEIWLVFVLSTGNGMMKSMMSKDIIKDAQSVPVCNTLWQCRVCVAVGCLDRSLAKRMSNVRFQKQKGRDERNRTKQTEE